MRALILIFCGLILISCDDDTLSSASSTGDDTSKTGTSETVASDPAPVNSCESDPLCEQRCGTLFHRPEYINACLGETTSVVNGMYNMFQILKEPSHNQLTDRAQVHSVDIRKFMNIYPDPIFDLFGSYSSENARVVLRWIAGSKGATIAFTYKDPKKKRSIVESDHILILLFKSLDSLKSDNFDISSAIPQIINESSSHDFTKEAIYNQNQGAVSWLYGTLGRNCEAISGENYSEDDSKSREKCLLKNIYCKNEGTLYKDNFDHIYNADIGLRRYIVDPKETIGGLGVSDGQKKNLVHICSQI